MKTYIAIVEDEPDIAKLISVHLDKAGFETKLFLDGKSFLKSLNKNIPQLVVLDLMLPDTDGIEICKHIRNERGLNSCKIIIVSAKGDEIDKILGLELGADDYVTKPFSPKELTARVKAVLRRESGEKAIGRISLGRDIKIDTEKFVVTIKGAEIELTSTEFKILRLFAENPGKVFSRTSILDKIWGNDKIVIDRTVDVHIRHLREKLGNASKIIKNIRGIGYKLDE